MFKNLDLKNYLKITKLENLKIQKNTTAIGKIGEIIAKRYLENKGYQIIAQNYRTRYAEIDLIAKKENRLIFVEVRTKKGEQFGSPEETLNQRKLRKLWFNASAYVKIKGWSGSYRIDAICLVLNPDNSIKRLDHYENISPD